MSIDSVLGTSLQQALFQYADKNKDGSLDTTELTSVASELTGTPNPTTAQVSDLQTQLDSNGNGKVSESEFLQASVAQANTNSLLDGSTMAAMLGTGIFGNDSSPYSALPGYNSNTDVTNLYSSLVGSTLSGSNTSTGDLTGQLLEGSLATKGLLV